MQEIEKILSEEARNGGAGSPSPELVHGLFSFAERTAKEIMVPRTRVVGVPIDATPGQVIELLAEEGHTRMPVYEGDLDHIKGVLHAKDVIPLMAHPELIVLQDIVRPALFVPWTKPVGELLREMQQKRSLLALVVDEYGGFSGIVTLEDILEEVAGRGAQVTARLVQPRHALVAAAHVQADRVHLPVLTRDALGLVEQRSGKPAPLQIRRDRQMPQVGGVGHPRFAFRRTWRPDR